MTYDEFKKELCRNVSLQGDYFNRQVRILEEGVVGVDEEEKRLIKRLNLSESGHGGKAVHEDYLYVQWGGSAAPNVNHWKVYSLYEIYLEEGWAGVLSEIIKKPKVFKLYKRDAGIQRGNYEDNSEHLILRPQNYWQSREDLADCIYWRFGDVALVLYAQLGDIGGEYVTMKIRRFMTENWNVEYERMLINALLNSYSQMPPRLFAIGDVRFFYRKEDGVFMKGETGQEIVIDNDNPEEGKRGYRLTTTNMKNGALAIFYPGVRERLAELLNGDFYVGFTSVHEAVIHPTRTKNPGEMKAAIQHINAVYDEREMLTNKVYRYYAKQEKFVEV